MSTSPYIFDITADNFDEIILQGSQSVPVLVDFWAPWCQPCKTLMPTLASLADAYQGKFILAKINTEEEQALATQFGIRSIPTVKLFKDGEAIDEFMGALPESEVRAFLERHIPRDSDNLIAQAELLIEQGKTAEAIPLIESARESDPGSPRVLLAYAKLKAALGDIDQAEEVLSELPTDEQDKPEILSLRARFDFNRIAHAAPEKEALKQLLAADGNQSEARYQLAAREVLEQAYEKALELLLQLMLKDRVYGDDAARKGMLAIFNILGGSGELVTRFRGRMFNALH